MLQPWDRWAVVLGHCCCGLCWGYRWPQEAFCLCFCLIHFLIPLQSSLSTFYHFGTFRSVSFSSGLISITWDGLNECGTLLTFTISRARVGILQIEYWSQLMSWLKVAWWLLISLQRLGGCVGLATLCSAVAHMQIHLHFFSFMEPQKYPKEPLGFTCCFRK